MPFIDVPLDDAAEQKAVPAGAYPIRIQSATEKKSKAGKDMIEVMMIIDGESEAAPIFQYLLFPSADDDEQVRGFRLRDLKRFLVAFGIPHEANGFEVEDFAGSTAELEVVQEEYDGGLQNRIKLPKFE